MPTAIFRIKDLILNPEEPIDFSSMSREGAIKLVKE
jgi:hypothetical protein